VILSLQLLLFANALSNDSNVIERSFKFGVGSALSALLLVLALRSTGENSVARLGFTACALTFTFSACIEQIALCLGQSAQSLIVLLAGDIAFCAAAAWPVTILGLWSQGPYSSAWRRQMGRAVFAVACCSAVLLSFAHGIGLLPHGLGPKAGANQLTIRARQRSDYLELTVEDNGVGASTGKKLVGRSSIGFGLPEPGGEVANRLPRQRRVLF
jgi:hypothetical protein